MLKMSKAISMWKSSAQNASHHILYDSHIIALRWVKQKQEGVQGDDELFAAEYECIITQLI